ncbi:hypothetical protein SDC9_169041 [bioreactor metagenome]|uniref:Uncharacterized protein n=1 Tax=bioreactor metagenome TaxID=1076179 RepID=A0A645G469_9ZZZZ
MRYEGSLEGGNIDVFNFFLNAKFQIMHHDNFIDVYIYGLGRG